MWGIGALITVAVLIAIFSAEPDASPDSSLDQRTCEIARDIAADFNVTDTISDSRARVADLYSGYGQSASPAIAAALRQWSAGMTSGDYASAARGVTAVGSACAAEGF